MAFFLSPVFSTFRCNSDRLDPQFLESFCRRQSVSAPAQSKSTGDWSPAGDCVAGAVPVTLYPPPPLAEQRRIVARIESVATKTAELESLLLQVHRRRDSFLRSLLVQASAGPSVKVAMAELLEPRKPDVCVKPDEIYKFAGVYCFGRGVFPSGTKAGAGFSYKELTRVHAGDFVYPKLMAWEGALAIVPPSCDGLVVSPEFPVFRVKTRQSAPRCPRYNLFFAGRLV